MIKSKTDEKYSMSLVEQTHKRGRIFVRLRNKRVISLLRPMVLFLLALIFVIFITSCSLPPLKVVSEFCSQSEEDCELEIIRILTTLFDISDDFTHKSRRNFTLTHFIERINIYNEEQFDYEIKRIKIK